MNQGVINCNIFVVTKRSSDVRGTILRNFYQAEINFTRQGTQYCVKFTLLRTCSCNLSKVEIQFFWQKWCLLSTKNECTKVLIFLQWESMEGLENHEKLVCTKHAFVHKSGVNPPPEVELVLSHTLPWDSRLPWCTIHTKKDICNWCHLQIKLKLYNYIHTAKQNEIKKHTKYLQKFYLLWESTNFRCTPLEVLSPEFAWVLRKQLS